MADLPANVLPFTYLGKETVKASLANISSSTLAAKIKAGKFPAPDYIGGRAMWRSDRIAAWLTEQAAEADAERKERNRKAQAKAQRLVASRVPVIA